MKSTERTNYESLQLRLDEKYNPNIWRFTSLCFLFITLYTSLLLQKEKPLHFTTSENVATFTPFFSNWNDPKPVVPVYPVIPAVQDPLLPEFHIHKEAAIDREGTSTLLVQGGTVSNPNTRSQILCKIGLIRSCCTNYIADSIDLVVAFAPLYAVHQEQQEDIYELHTYFIGMMNVIGIRVQVIEAINPSRNQTFKRTRPDNEPWEMQVTINDSFYYRENLLNVAARKTYDLWEYMLWIDAHQVFFNTYWWEETIYRLEHFNAVHLCQTITYSTVNTSHPIMLMATYAYNFKRKLEGVLFFAGNGWGMRKEVYKKIDFILDYCIAGACDYSLILALMKSDSDWDGISIFPHYFEELRPWIDETRTILNGSYKNVRGQLRHIDHSHFLDYFGIQQNFSTCCFDAKNDLYRDENFLLHTKNLELKKYFP